MKLRGFSKEISTLFCTFNGGLKGEFWHILLGEIFEIGRKEKEMPYGCNGKILKYGRCKQLVGLLKR